MGERGEQVKPVSSKSTRIAFGVAVGGGAGLLVDSVILVPTSIYSLMGIWPVVLPAVLGLGTGAFLGWKGWLPGFSWPFTLLGSIALWALCVWIPVKIRVWQFATLAYRENRLFREQN
jgi:hypothetical protein